jgi:hypothetical protein
VTAIAIPDFVQELVLRSGPFASAYLDATRAKEQGGREIELRWQELRADLAAQGADEAGLAAMDAAAGGQWDVPGTRGQLMVAVGGSLVCDRLLPRPPVRPLARWSPLPHLMPYLAQSGPRVAHVLVVADRTGADIATATGEAAEQRPTEWETVAGSAQYPVHKTSTVDWSERHFQLRVENSWERNARDVAGEVGKRAADVAAELVVLAGDETARALLRDELPGVLGPQVEVVDVAAGGRAAGSSPAALDEAVHDALLQQTWRRRREMLEHLQQNVGRGDYAVTGVTDVLAAVRRSQVDTVIISDDPTSTLTAWIGPEPLHLGSSRDELRELGVADPQQDRFDSALLRAVVGSGARLLITPNAHDYVRDGIAALLRYTDASTPAP